MKKYFPILVVNLVSIILICYPFIKGNTLITLDLPGHVFATTFMRDNIFPNISGWNPFQNLGYPEGSHYPPFMQYVASAISIVSSLDIVNVYKILVVVMLLLLPWSILFFIKKLSKGELSNLLENAIAIVTFLMFIILPSTFGGTLKALLSTGLLNNFLTNPIFYVYLGFLVDFWNSKTNKFLIIKLSVLLSFLILSHLVGGLVGAFVGGVIILVKVIKQKDFKALLIPFISLLLTGFFVIPYVITSRYLTASKPILSDLPSSLGILLIVVVTLIVIFIKTKQKTLIIFTICSFILILLPLFEAVTYRISGLTNFQLINAYRILPYAFYIGIPLFLITISKLLSKISLVKRFETIGIVILLLVTAGVIYKSNLQLRDIGGVDANKVFTSTLSSNYLDLYSRYDFWDNLRVPYMNLSDIKLNNFSVMGQFEESSYLNHFALSLKNSLDPLIKKTPVSKVVYIEDMTLNPKKVQLVKDLFNVGYGTQLNENDKSICVSSKDLQTFDTRYNDLGKFGMKSDVLSLCELPNPSNSDINIYSDTGIFRNVAKQVWNSEVIKWWTDDKNEILVEGSDLKIEGTGKKLDNINIRLNWTPNYQEFSFSIPTEKDSWAIVKEQYNPRWKAYDSSGKELTVYRVSPSMMMVNSKGIITFKYEFNWWENLLKLVSLFGFPALSLYSIVSARRISKRK
ncbi:MAG: hypothetical protein WCO33_01460 [bacterium]